MLKPDFESYAQCYSQLLSEYQSLETQVPLAANDVVKYGGNEFRRLMGLAVAAGHYSDEWTQTADQFLDKLRDSMAEGQTLWPAEFYDALMGLEDDMHQIHPAWALAQVPPSPVTQPDTLADQLAQGATLCELF